MATNTLHLESAPATPVASADRSTWDRALAEYLRISAESSRLWALHTAADEAHDRRCPRVARYFDEFGLYVSITRELAVETMRRHLRGRESVTGIVLWPAIERDAQEAMLAKLNAEAERIADEFFAYLKRNSDARKECRLDELDAQARAYDRAHYFAARENLMELPAPDSAGLLVKLEISAMSLETKHGESAMADARRLLAA